MTRVRSQQLRLETTGQFLGAPIVGSHDNSRPEPEALSRCLHWLRVVGCN